MFLILIESVPFCWILEKEWQCLYDSRLPLEYVSLSWRLHIQGIAEPLIWQQNFYLSKSAPLTTCIYRWQSSWRHTELGTTIQVSSWSLCCLLSDSPHCVSMSLAQKRYGMANYNSCTVKSVYFLSVVKIAAVYCFLVIYVVLINYNENV